MSDKPRTRNWYPHLLAHDAALLTQWLTAYASSFERIIYDVPLGSGYDPGSEYDQNIRDQIYFLTRARADAIGYSGQQATIIEVTQNATLKTCAQLLVYRTLLTTDAPAQPTPQVCIVARRSAHNVGQLLEAWNIGLYLVPLAFENPPRIIVQRPIATLSQGGGLP